MGIATNINFVKTYIFIAICALAVMSLSSCRSKEIAQCDIGSDLTGRLSSTRIVEKSIPHYVQTNEAQPIKYEQTLVFTGECANTIISMDFFGLHLDNGVILSGAGSLTSPFRVRVNSEQDKRRPLEFLMTNVVPGEKLISVFDIPLSEKEQKGKYFLGVSKEGQVWRLHAFRLDGQNRPLQVAYLLQSSRPIRSASAIFNKSATSVQLILMQEPQNQEAIALVFNWDLTGFADELRTPPSPY